MGRAEISGTYFEGLRTTCIEITDTEERKRVLTIRVEDARNTDVDAILTMEAVGQRLCNSLAFIVACTWTDRVDMTPAGVLFSQGVKHGINHSLVFRLRVYLRVTIDL